MKIVFILLARKKLQLNTEFYRRERRGLLLFDRLRVRFVTNRINTGVMCGCQRLPVNARATIFYKNSNLIAKKREEKCVTKPPFTKYSTTYINGVGGALGKVIVSLI